MGVFSVCDRISNNIFKEMSQTSTDLFTAITSDWLHSVSAGKPTDRGLCNALTILPHHFQMGFYTAFVETLTTLATAFRTG